jgi:hypothetical protein
VERWNIGFQKDMSHFIFIVNPVGGGTINPTLHYPRTHYSTIPVFHHSNRTTLSLDPEVLEGRLSTGCERSELTCSITEAEIQLLERSGRFNFSSFVFFSF